MKDWYSPRDLLGGDDEYLIAESSSEQESLDFIARTAGLTAQDAR